jgi:hypothetical protein
VTDTEHVAQHRGAEQRRPAGKRNHGPRPYQSVGGQQYGVNRANPATPISRSIIDRSFQECEHDQKSSHDQMPARARTKRLSSFGSSTDAPRPVFVASTTADGRSPGSRIGASSYLPGDKRSPVAYADETSRSQLRGQLRIRSFFHSAPHSLFALLRETVVSDTKRSPGCLCQWRQVSAFSQRNGYR